MRRRRQVCEWQHCAASAVGYRHWWQFNVLIRYWFCRRHQRWWDRGTRQRGSRRPPDLGLYEP